MLFNFFQGVDQMLQANSEKEMLVWYTDKPEEIVTRYTGRDILNRVGLIGHYLSTQKVVVGQKVLVGLPVGFDLICTILAIMAIGAIPVLPPAAASGKQVLRLLRQDKIKVVITEKKPSLFRTLLTKIFGIKIINSASLPKLAVNWLQALPVDPAQPALISHSSGSTGQAKSIRRSHQVLIAQHQALKEIFPGWPEQRDFPLFPNILLHNLAVGTTSILPNLNYSSFTSLNPATIIEQIKTEKVNTLTGNVFYFRKLLQHLEQHPDKFLQVKAVGIGGSPVPEVLVRALQAIFPVADIYVIYGSSEAEPIAVRKVSPEVPAPERGYLVGKIHPSLKVQFAPLGEIIFKDGIKIGIGEIMVQGSHVVTTTGSYWKSGDYGYISKNNELYLTGRQGNERLHGGVQHYQIEHVLLHQEGIQKAAAKSTETGFEIYLEGNTEEAQLRTVLETYFPKDIIKAIYFREYLPVDVRHHSKILYEKLR